jgi:hypothetical protein
MISAAEACAGVESIGDTMGGAPSLGISFSEAAAHAFAASVLSFFAAVATMSPTNAAAGGIISVTTAFAALTVPMTRAERLEKRPAMMDG